MRFFTFLVGVIFGVGGAVAYMVFAAPMAPPPPSAALPKDPPLSVTFGESLITDLLKHSTVRAPGVEIPPGALRAELRDGVIVIHADVDIVGQSSRGSAVVRPLLRDGRIAFEVVETTLGVLPLPQLESLVNQQVNARLQGVLNLLPVQITGIRVEQATGITVSCQVDLARLTRPTGS